MANYGSAALATKREAPKLSGEVFGALINLSGRRRFTSQRLVLYAVLAGQGQEDAIVIGREALGLFRAAHTTLINGSDTVPGIFCPALEEAYFGRTGGDRQIQAFMEHADRTLAAAERGARNTQELIAELVQITTPLLALLNQLTSIYEEQSKRHAVQMKNQLRAVITDIETIARQARMVSFNARVVAARSGVAGREFAVVANELSNITGEIDDMVKTALATATA
ncbi:methyl-accepting chemotaxis protein [Pseudoduganella namucuonensis]|uniref:Type IV pili methyl-accepting chemotaxis transducer N-term n=1 Tax=Pseudoduganella namucuonensis TaxID=1035707 RepID=A0A1I7KIQ1_9BURK|nr:methyl-accepting chemotaxis protein [Pseudoduganella namucuonensis]SFU97313.1 Type IV pili methyl-accepting chemotaxis transducer N-term [Pseudoduganella namucuonensis]